MISHYSRLFGGPFAGHDETHLREPSTRMKDIPQNRRGRPRRGRSCAVGFRLPRPVFGSRSDSRRNHPRTHDGRSGENKKLHAPRLNLESVYGNGPQKSPDLYDHSKRDSETFLLGYTEALPRKKIPSMPDDFYRRDGRPARRQSFGWSADVLPCPFFAKT